MAAPPSIRWYGEPLASDTPIFHHIPARFFELLVRRRALHFKRLDGYQVPGADPLEGKHSTPMLDWFDRGFSGTANAAQSRRHVRENEGRLARRTAISCWTLSGDSSLERWAIWNRVAGDVQIATTIGRLLDALDGPRLALGRVIYADHAVDWIRQNEDIVHLAYAKGTKFRAENEVRVALAPDPMLEAQEIPVSGGDVPFVSAGWIKGVRLHPDSSAVHADWLDRLLVSWQM